jgi:prefoldin subunit 2
MSSPFTAEETQTAIRRYNELVQEQQQIAQKISEFEMESNEHRMVEETLAPLDASRRAYRLVGEVLVERTVEEVLPSVKQNRENVSR